MFDERMLTAEALLQELNGSANILHVHLMLASDGAEHMQLNKVDERPRSLNRTSS